MSRLPDGTVGDGSSYASSVSADGRYVVFTTAASNLASPPPGASGPAMLAVRDMLDGSFARVDVLDSGEPFDQSRLLLHAGDQRRRNRDRAAVAFGTRLAMLHLGRIARRGHDRVERLAGVGVVSNRRRFRFNRSEYERGVGLARFVVLAVDRGDRGRRFRRRSAHGAVRRRPNNTGVGRDGWIQVGSQYIPIHQDGTGDTTPPVITPVVNGTLGDNGWYTSNVSVSFSYDDPDSPISSAVGCDLTTQTTDTAGTTFTCTVTSEGGSASGSLR